MESSKAIFGYFWFYVINFSGRVFVLIGFWLNFDIRLILCLYKFMMMMVMCFSRRFDGFVVVTVSAKDVLSIFFWIFKFLLFINFRGNMLLKYIFFLFILNLMFCKFLNVGGVFREVCIIIVATFIVVVECFFMVICVFFFIVLMMLVFFLIVSDVIELLMVFKMFNFVMFFLVSVSYMFWIILWIDITRSLIMCILSGNVFLYGDLLVNFKCNKVFLLGFRFLLNEVFLDKEKFVCRNIVKGLSGYEFLLFFVMNIGVLKCMFFLICMINLFLSWVLFRLYNVFREVCLF